MAVFRSGKTGNFTVMANRHLRDMRLSLRARGLLSLMLSLPEDWDYSLRGLAVICAEGEGAISAALRELEVAGYVRRTRVRDEMGRVCRAQYDIYEGGGLPACSGAEPPAAENAADKAGARERKVRPEKARAAQKTPICENPVQGNPVQENAPQQSTEEQKTERQIHLSVRVGGAAGRQMLPMAGAGAMDAKEGVGTAAVGQRIRDGPPGAQQATRQVRSGAAPPAKQAVGGVPLPYSGQPPEVLRSRLRRQIEAAYLARKFDAARVEEVVCLLADVLGGSRQRVRIGGEQRCADEVKRRFAQLEAAHVEYVLQCMDTAAPEVRNIRGYLLACLFNAPASIESYWQAQVCHDRRLGKI